jgi:tetratricopeptide (TPR) repeat protein
MFRVPVAALVLVSVLVAAPVGLPRATTPIAVGQIALGPMALGKIALGAIAFGVAPAAADADADADVARRAKARDLTERAIEKVRVGDHEAAIDLYLRAYELSSEAILLSNIGSAYQSLGRRERALRYFCRYLEADPTGKLAGFAREQAQQISTDLGQRAMCEKQADKPKPPSAGTAGTAGTADTADTGPGLIGSREDRGTIDRSSSSEVTGSVSSGKEPRLAAPLRTGGLVLAGVGVIGLGIGGYYGYVGKQASDVISNNDDGWTAEELEQQEIGKRANTRMTIALISGGSAVVVGTALYFLGRSMRVEGREVAVVPQVSPESSGFAVIGSF